jgi:hypothetical protein
MYISATRSDQVHDQLVEAIPKFELLDDRQLVASHFLGEPGGELPKLITSFGNIGLRDLGPCRETDRAADEDGQHHESGEAADHSEP